jgi:hypothetical protein
MREIVKCMEVTPWKSDTARAAVLGQIRFGGNGLNGLVFTRSEENYISLNLLSRFVVIFDFPHNSMYVKRGIRFEEPEFFEPDRSGLVILRRSGRIFIDSVASGTPASRAGMRAGDVIESVDGMTADNIHLMSLRYQLCVKGKSLRFVVASGSEKREVVIKLE